MQVYKSQKPNLGVIQEKESRKLLKNMLHKSMVWRAQPQEWFRETRLRLLNATSLRMPLTGLGRSSSCCSYVRRGPRALKPQLCPETLLGQASAVTASKASGFKDEIKKPQTLKSLGSPRQALAMVCVHMPLVPYPGLGTTEKCEWVFDSTNTGSRCGVINDKQDCCWGGVCF